MEGQTLDHNLGLSPSWLLAFGWPLQAIAKLKKVIARLSSRLGPRPLFLG